MDYSLVPSPIPTDNNGCVTFKCHVDKRQYTLPIVFSCIFFFVILLCSPNFLVGILGIFFLAPPLAVVLFLSHHFWSGTVYTVDNKTLRLSSNLKTVVIEIDKIKKITRGRFWVERRYNFSAAYIKLRIIYDKNQYVYVSPENEEAFVNLLQSINKDIVYNIERNL
ncbi:MAG: PH domain-containing protein [Muribaculaceae bacterium]|nr:PH domain-containing protein [Muribaculaceae bacterium]